MTEEGVSQRMRLLFFAEGKNSIHKGVRIVSEENQYEARGEKNEEPGNK